MSTVGVVMTVSQEKPVSMEDRLAAVEVERAALRDEAMADLAKRRAGVVEARERLEVAIRVAALAGAPASAIAAQVNVSESAVRVVLAGRALSAYPGVVRRRRAKGSAAEPKAAKVAAK